MSKKKEKEAKTNAMRLLDMLHVPYRHYSYECREFVDAWHTAQALGCLLYTSDAADEL